LKSSSIIEDVVWYTKNIVDEVNIPVVIILSNCNINSSDTNQISVLITDNNPFDEKIWISLSVLLEIWNFINIILSTIKIFNTKTKLSKSCLVMETLLGVIRIFLLIEPLPNGVFHSHLTFHILYGINFTLSSGIVFLICYSILEIIKKLTLLLEYKKISAFINHYKLPFIIIIILIIIDFIFSCLKGLYISISIIEKISLIYYLILINILFLLCLIT